MVWASEGGRTSVIRPNDTDRIDDLIQRFSSISSSEPQIEPLPVNFLPLFFFFHVLMPDDS